ncbi:ribosomal RNA methyltransferase MRM2 [Apiosordaria backusii]|uniref:rRNA methyltransferase 2, mitochondrial n=1 Tax=Apiosordaria backusii TaxID=314023 RepID=A0AA40DFU8_9PEZI|nr:ribosomal RNA methyltransferase MRM2 [Apiosordaria backusii]
MSEPWPQTQGFSINSLSNPYSYLNRMMNTSGISFADHAGSMDLCKAALSFASETLRPGGHFVCKFYQGQEDKALELLLRKMFAKVHREKPESSRSESREGFFVALRRKADVTLEDAEGSS